MLSDKGEGVEGLAKHLNSYFGQMVRIIASEGGDVFKVRSSVACAVRTLQGVSFSSLGRHPYCHVHRVRVHRRGVVRCGVVLLAGLRPTGLGVCGPLRWGSSYSFYPFDVLPPKVDVRGW